MRVRLLRSDNNRIMSGNNLIVLQFFGLACVGGMAGQVMGTVEFELLVTFSCDDSDL